MSAPRFNQQRTAVYLGGTISVPDSHSWVSTSQVSIKKHGLRTETYDYWLVVWNIFYFPIYLEHWSQLTNIFQRVRYTTNQKPATSTIIVIPRHPPQDAKAEFTLSFSRAVQASERRKRWKTLEIRWKNPWNMVISSYFNKHRCLFQGTYSWFMIAKLTRITWWSRS